MIKSSALDFQYNILESLECYKSYSEVYNILYCKLKSSGSLTLHWLSLYQV